MQSKSLEVGSIDAVKVAASRGNDFYFHSVSPSMRGLEQIIADIAPTDIPVLLVGESGSGKQVLAQQIHRLSRRGNEPFVKISCATFTPEFLDQRLGKAPRADMQGPSNLGTIFLDEINELDVVSQSKLLQFLPDGGVGQEHCLGSRVISATHKSLEEEMAAGRFREELYYRINGVCLRLPPLRQRKEDLPGLVDFLLKRYAALFGYPAPNLTSQGMLTLLHHNWPGNIRELENAIKKIVALGDDGLALSELSYTASEVRTVEGAAQRLSLKQAARAASHVAERELILRVLAQTRWNRKRAAKELQISYKALLYKLKQIGMDDSQGSLRPRGGQG